MKSRTSHGGKNLIWSFPGTFILGRYIIVMYMYVCRDIPNIETYIQTILHGT